MTIRTVCTALVIGACWSPPLVATHARLERLIAPQVQLRRAGRYAIAWIHCVTQSVRPRICDAT